MKKSIIGFILILTFAITLTGCGTNNEKTNQEEKTNGGTTKTSYNFEDLKSDLLTLDSSTEVNEKSASMIGAEEGYGYIIGECTMEVYKYDKNSDQYKKAVKEQKISMPSFDMTFNATVKNGYAYNYNWNYDYLLKIVILYKKELVIS